MRFGKILCLVLVVALVTGCGCFKKRSSDGDNIPVAQPGGPLADVNFGFDSYALNSSAKGTLEANAAWLRQNADKSVQVEGHCDERGTNEYNMVLGMNRARSAFDYLRSLGISADRMSTVSYGEELPLDPRHNEEAWDKNRRAHSNVK